MPHFKKNRGIGNRRRVGIVQGVSRDSPVTNEKPPASLSPMTSGTLSPKQMASRWLISMTLGLFAGCAGNLPPQVVVVGDLTTMGKGLTPPDAAHPVYYFPLPVGYKELGATYAGEKPPPAKNAVSHTLAVALAKQHYLVMTPEHPPTQVLVFWWGSLNPVIEDWGSNDPMDRTFFNEREMMALVGAYKLQMPFGSRVDDVKAAAQDDRYFVVVMAFDYAAATRREKKLLWAAKMSTPSNGTDLAAVIPALVASGAPVFGRDTQPDFVDSANAMKEATVTIAPLEVKETLPADRKPPESK